MGTATTGKRRSAASWTRLKENSWDDSDDEEETEVVKAYNAPVQPNAPKKAPSAKGAMLQTKRQPKGRRRALEAKRRAKRGGKIAWMRP